MFDKTLKHIDTIVVKLGILIALIVFVHQFLHADQCADWFVKTNSAEADDCLSSCLVAKKDLSNFLCSQQCEAFCSNNKGNPFNFLTFYGLTKEEIKYCTENRVTCLSAYRLTWKAESLCTQIYRRSSVNDESDACRHYVWAILLSRDIGLEQASILLDAHETHPDESQEEKEMDLKNNEIGISDYKRLQNKNLSDEKILSMFKDAVSAKRFNVLEPKYPKTGGLP